MNRSPRRTVEGPAATGSAVRLLPAGLIRVALLVAMLIPVAAQAAAAGPRSCSDWGGALEGAVMKVAHYPSVPAIQLYLDLRSVPHADQLTAARLELPSAPGPKSWPLKLSAALHPGGLRERIDLPALAQGTHRLVLRVDAPGCGTLAGPAAAIRVTHFAWQGSQLGVADDVRPPFEPVKVDGSRVSVVLRELQMGTTGLPEKITSLGEPLLSGAVHLEGVVDGHRVVPVPRTPAVVSSRSQSQAEVTAAFTMGPLEVSLAGSFDLDGLYRIALGVSGPPSTRVDQLDLVIPLRPEHATLMNAITDGTRHHVLGAVPGGRGEVWNAMKVGRDDLDPGFVPYLWLGDEERGISFLAESTRDWWFASGHPMAEVRRTPRGVDVVIHLASSPGNLARPRHIDFALQPTPAKPRPEKPVPWRLWQDSCDAPRGFLRICPLEAGYYWGAASAYGHVEPRDGDDSILKRLAQVRHGGRWSKAEITRWLDRHRVPAGERREASDSLKYAFAKLSTAPDVVVAYVNAQGVAPMPELEAFADEWLAAPFGDRKGRTLNPSRVVPTIPRASFRDYAIWHLDRLLQSGAIDGFMFDNTFLRASWDDVVGTAYRDERGRLHPGVEIYSMRELLRRAFEIVSARRDGAVWNIAHLTTTPISAIHDFAGLSLGGEWKYGSDPYQERFPRDLMRAASLGAQTGTVPVYLPGLREPDPIRADRLRRELVGVTALHEIRIQANPRGGIGEAWERLRKAGYGDPSCHVGRYWDPDAGFRVLNLDAEALVVRCPGRSLALVVNYGRGGMAELQLDGAGPGLSCKDAESGIEVQAIRGSCRFPMERYGVRWLRIRERAAR